MADNDDYMTAKATNDEITELMWDRLQEGINANRRFRLKGIAGGNNMRYSSTKVVWDSDIYIYFTRESDGAWVYNKINANPTTGIACGNDDLLYVVLNDTSGTVLTVTAADYTSMLTDDTGRVLILGAVSASTWYGNVMGGVGEHDNTFHSTNYEAANANIQSHVGGTPPTDSHHTRYADSEVETVITAEIVDGQSIDAAIDALVLTHKNLAAAHHAKYTDGDVESVITAEIVDGQSIDVAIDALILTHKNLAAAHHTKTTSFGDLTDDIVYTQIDSIVDIAGAGATNLISRADHVHTAADGSSKVTYSSLLSIPSTFAPSVHSNTAHSPNYLASVLGDTTPQLGGELDFYNKRMNLNATAVSNNNATGIIINMTAAQSLVFPNLVYVNSNGDAGLADADSSDYMPAIGMALETKSVTQTIKILVFGFVYRSTWAWAVGGGGESRLLYASRTPGGMTQDPTGYTTGDQVQVVAMILEADRILFNPSLVLVEVK